MNDSLFRLAKILRASPDALRHMDEKMSFLTGQHGVLDSIAQENNILVERTLAHLGLTRSDAAETVYAALINQLIRLDEQLFELLHKPNLLELAGRCGQLCETALKVFTPPKGLFIKKEKVVQLLEIYKPDNLLNHFGYTTVAELVEKEGFAPVVASLRFAQDTEWMHTFFDQAYTELTADDFEERDVEIIVLEKKWLDVAEKFLQKKYHNVSHLKEFGVIFMIPLQLEIPGETLRLFTLLLHYLHEVPFYSGLFRRYMPHPDFTTKFKSLLRGDVPDKPAADGKRIVWRIVQRYLAKDDENDFRLHEPHVNPEADHWFRAEDDLQRLSRILPVGNEVMSLGYWTGLDFVGDFFKDKDGKDHLISFDLIDLIMSLVQKGRIKYLYHQQEALWNKMFTEYLGRERMNRLIEENIVEGFIEL